jgi:putative alpha-1,2-mannosidase
VIGRPFVDRAALTLPNAKVFTVVADGLSDTNRYIGEVTLNGVRLAKSVVTHAQILGGGELRFTMQATPNTRWATKKAARPYSMTSY